MKLRLFLALIVSTITAFATPPAWWPNSGTQQNNALNYAPANLGQLKNMAKSAKAHLDQNLVGGAGDDIDDMIAAFEPRQGNTYTPGEIATILKGNYAPVNMGQVKAVAQKFYDRLVTYGYDTRQNLLDRGFPSNWNESYPWSYDAPLSSNYAPANLGQLKAVFSFDLSKLDIDHDGLPDGWEIARTGDLSPLGTADTDGDGASDAQEFAEGTDPTNAASNGAPAIAKISGDNQRGAPASIAGVPLLVQVTTAGGVGLAGVPVTYTVLSGGGAVVPDRVNPVPASSSTVHTDQYGIAFASLKYPSSVSATTQIQASVHAGSQTNSVVFSAATLAAPANDSFSNAVSLNSISSPRSQSNEGATLQSGEPKHGDVLQGASVWFTWTAPATGSVEFSTAGSAIDTVLAVYQGATLGQLVEVASSDDRTESEPRLLTSRLAFRAVQGVTYRIAVAGFDGETGNIQLSWGNFNGPSNDFFETPAIISGVLGVDSGSNVGATLQASEPQHNREVQGGSVWYKYQAINTGWLHFSATAAFNSVVAAYSGTTLGNLLPVAAKSGDGSSNPVEVTIPVSAGTTYWIAIAGIDDFRGTFLIGWNFEKLNDNFGDAKPIANSSGSISGTNVGATKESGEPDHVDSGGASVWYAWTAPATGEFVFDTVGSNFDTTLAVYTGSAVNSLTQLASDDQSGGNGTSLIQFSAVQGTVYMIAVDGWTGNTGNIVLNWREAPAALRVSGPVEENSTQNEVEEGATFDGKVKRMLAAAGDEEDCEEGGPEANKGEVIYKDGDQEKSARTIYLSIPKPISPKANDDPCPQTVVVQHKIVTTNTPRARDLPGKLYIRLKEGDASKVEISHDGSPYTLGTPVAVTELGHSGCGVHDWHVGNEEFEFKALEKGTVVYEIECDPDPDDGGDGQATKKFELTVVAFELTYEADPPEQQPIPPRTPWTGDASFTPTPEMSKQKITLKTDPPEVAAMLELEVDEFDETESPEYQPDDRGTIENTSPEVWEYTAFEEKKTYRAPRSKKVIIIAKIDKEEMCVKFKSNVVPFFKWMVQQHRHGPGTGQHQPTADEHLSARLFALWKYDINTPNIASVTYKPGPDKPIDGANAQTFFNRPRGSRNMEIYFPAFDSENWCASVSGHENVHGGQTDIPWAIQGVPGIVGLPTKFNSVIEYEAWKWQLDHAADCGLSEEEKNIVIGNVERTKQGHPAE